MKTDQRTEGLHEFMQTKFPSQQEAIQTIWGRDPSELPDAIRDSLEREAIIACYAEKILLTMEKYPAQLARGYLWLTSCEPETPHLSTSYATDDSDFFIGDDLPNWGYGYEGIELKSKTVNFRDEADKNSRKPLFVAINQLRTDHMPERLRHYRLFRSLVGTAYDQAV
jgi:hypothetical protein